MFFLLLHSSPSNPFNNNYNNILNLKSAFSTVYLNSTFSPVSCYFFDSFPLNAYV